MPGASHLTVLSGLKMVEQYGVELDSIPNPLIAVELEHVEWSMEYL
jgi:hypothetical protein